MTERLNSKNQYRQVIWGSFWFNTGHLGFVLAITKIFLGIRVGDNVTYKGSNALAYRHPSRCFTYERHFLAAK